MTRFRVFALLAVLGCATSLPAQLPGAQSQLQREVERALIRLGISDSLNARAVAAGTPAAAYSMSMTLARHGVGRLDSTTLRVRAELLVKIFGAADVATCAAWSRGTLDATRSMALFDTMDSVTTSRWGEVSAKAIAAELKATAPVPAPTGPEMIKTFTTIRTVMTAADKAKLDDLLPRLATSSDDENCWFSRSLFGNALKLPDADRAMVLGILARFEAQ